MLCSTDYIKGSSAREPLDPKSNSIVLQLMLDRNVHTLDTFIRKESSLKAEVQISFVSR